MRYSNFVRAKKIERDPVRNRCETLPTAIKKKKQKKTHTPPTSIKKQMLSPFQQRTQIGHSYEHPAVLVLVPSDSYAISAHAVVSQA